MKISFPFVLALCFSAFWDGRPIQAQDSQNWIKLTTPNLELYTDTSSVKARNLLTLFEAAEAVRFGADAPGDADGQTPLRLIVFANKEEYAPFRLNSVALGHYLHSADRDYIVLGDAEPEHFQAAVHEYTHFAVSRAGFHLPLWLNEGVADLYSTAAKTGTALVGAPLPGRLSTLSSGRLLQLRELFAVERGSSLYSDPDKASLFYAESWALTHLLAMDSRYAAQFPELLTRLNTGQSSAEALWRTYRTTPEQLQSELPAYIRQIHGGRPAVRRAEAGENVQPVQTIVSDLEKRMVWADLLAAHPSTAARAREQLLELEKLCPGQREPEELLARIAWRAKHPDEARVHWANAIDQGSHDFETLYRYALLLHATGAPSEQVIAAMEKAVTVNPDSDEALYNLGVLKYGERQYEEASQTLLRVKKVAPEQAYTYYSVLAYCQMKMRAFDRAKTLLFKAAESARTAEEQAENSRMMRFAAVRAD